MKGWYLEIPMFEGVVFYLVNLAGNRYWRTRVSGPRELIPNQETPLVKKIPFSSGCAVGAAGKFFGGGHT